MKLLAISDLHVGSAANRAALEQLDHHLEDWLILGGDLGETLDHVGWVLDLCVPRFARVIWVPGNHELWSTRGSRLHGVAKYDALVTLCRSRGVLTPEDDYAVWPGAGPPTVIAPLFVLYDYSFAPDGIPPERAVQWAMDSGVLCSDEPVLRPDPYPSRIAWCHDRIAITEARLARLPSTVGTVLINHFPLRRELARLPRIPRFAIWCGTRRTEDWHRRFRARVVVSGHLHIRGTTMLDDVTFHEVSLGYPGDWDPARGIDGYLRTIL